MDTVDIEKYVREIRHKQYHVATATAKQCRFSQHKSTVTTITTKPWRQSHNKDIGKIPTYKQILRQRMGGRGQSCFFLFRQQKSLRSIGKKSFCSSSRDPFDFCSVSLSV
jgi:hypothetical protein